MLEGMPQVGGLHALHCRSPQPHACGQAEAGLSVAHVVAICSSTCTACLAAPVEDLKGGGKGCQQEAQGAKGLQGAKGGQGWRGTQQHPADLAYCFPGNSIGTSH